MSIEMPEATILARQMQAELPGKTVAGFELRGCESLQRMGFVNSDPNAFADLVGESVESMVSRGNTMVVKLSGGQNLILAPEYGGEILYHKNADSLPAKYHFRLDLADGSALTVRIITMGAICAARDDGIGRELHGAAGLRARDTASRRTRLSLQICSRIYWAGPGANSSRSWWARTRSWWG